MIVSQQSIERIFSLALVSMLVLSPLVACGGEYDDQRPSRLDGVGVDEQLGQLVDASATFTDQDGGVVSIPTLLQDRRPILLTLNYSNCPGLCVAQLNGLVKGINEVGSLHLGTDFKMVSVSIDPREGVERAGRTHDKYSDDLLDHHKPAGWRFLVGTESNIIKLADSVGFRYSYDKKHDQFNHSAVAVLISPTGRITRYLSDIAFTGATLKMAIVEAGEGRVGSPMDALVLWCSHYDASEGRYSGSARILLSAVAGTFVVLGLMASLPFWLSRKLTRARELVEKRQQAQETGRFEDAETIGHT